MTNEELIMSNEEAKEILINEIQQWKNNPDLIVGEPLYIALYTAINALEKDIAKEPVQTHKRYGHGNEYDDYYCPECDKFLAYEPQGNRYKQEGGWSRCINCGQKIKWEE